VKKRGLDLVRGESGPEEGRKRPQIPQREEVSYRGEEGASIRQKTGGKGRGKGRQGREGV